MAYVYLDVKRSGNVTKNFKNAVISMLETIKEDEVIDTILLGICDAKSDPSRAVIFYHDLPPETPSSMALDNIWICKEWDTRSNYDSLYTNCRIFLNKLKYVQAYYSRITFSDAESGFASLILWYRELKK